jgi:transketolase N-terminal domain/subunit
LDIETLRARHPDHWMRACAIRTLTLDAVAAANSGHSGMPMGMADVATVLFEKHLNFDPAAPRWANRDRFILSAGHGSMLIYALLYLTGYADVTLEQVKNFRQWGAITAGHPEYGHVAGVETTTGPLGQGIANSVGFAIAEENLRARWGSKIMDHYTYVIAGDGCLMEGVSQEAIGLAGKQKLSRLIVLWDDNGDHHRRQGVHRRCHRPEGTFCGLGLECFVLRWARPRGYRPRAGRGQGVGPPDDDRLQNPYRAGPCRPRHVQGPWRTDRCRANGGGESGLWLDRRAV